jgi:hypothetical protein
LTKSAPGFEPFRALHSHTKRLKIVIAVHAVFKRHTLQPPLNSRCKPFIERG